MGYVGNAPAPVNGDYSKLDDISSSFNGVATAFTLLVGSVDVVPAKETAVILSVGGILQEPIIAYTIAGSTVTFTSPPAAGAGFFGMVMGESFNIGTPADGTVTLAKMAANSVDSDQYIDGSIDLVHMSANSVDSDQYVDGSIDNDHIANGTIAMSKTALTAGTGLTLATNDLSVDASQAQITTLANVVTVGTIGTGTWEATDVGVAHGGTGVSTLTDHGVVLGSGTDAVSVTAAGTAGQVFTSGGASADPSFVDAVAGGVTDVDQWRLTTAFTGIAQPISANWERNDGTGFGLLGTGMTSPSSGVFAFPSTGYWMVEFFVQWNGGGAATSVESSIGVTTDNATYVDVTRARGGAYQSGAPQSISQSHLVDVTSTTNVKVRFNIDYNNNGTVEGLTTQNRTYVTFTRLSDT